jgi:hypothetical protein
MNGLDFEINLNLSVLKLLRISFLKITENVSVVIRELQGQQVQIIYGDDVGVGECHEGQAKSEKKISHYYDS